MTLEEKLAAALATADAVLAAKVAARRRAQLVDAIRAIVSDQVRADGGDMMISIMATARTESVGMDAIVNIELGDIDVRAS